MRELKEAVVAGYVRTPFGKADPQRGFFRKVRSDDLAVIVLREILECTGVAAKDVDGIILGAVEMMGEQAHPGTAIPFLAGFPSHVTGLSVERACTTAMMSVHIATMSVQCGVGDIYIAGGLDSMTHFRIPVIKDGMDMNEVIKEAGTMLSTMNPNPKMAEMINLIELNGGQGAERLCEQFNISRREMDEWALRSHQRAIAATQAGRFTDEIVPVDGLLPDGMAVRIDYDQGPRADTTLEKISALTPVYRPDGRITPATSSGQADGAAVCMIMSRARADTLGIKPLARIHTIATGACAPTDLIYSAIPATHAALRRSGLGTDDLGLIEVNEAFACAPIALMREFNLPDGDADKINVNGGACALGHPVGASGARLVGTLALEMRRRGVQFGLATICGGMGQGQQRFLRVREPNDIVDARHAMVDELLRQRVIRTPAVERAFRRVARHALLPSPYILSSDPLLAESEETDDACHVYSDVATALTRDKQVSCVAPGLVAAQVEQLAADDGMRVLHVGTGSGYCTAILAELVGERGTVVGVEYAPDLAKLGAGLVAQAGYTTVTIREGDGTVGVPEAAPFDRILVSGGVADIALAWVQQLADEGTLVLPLCPASPLAMRMRGGTLLTIRRTADALWGSFSTVAFFATLRGTLASPADNCEELADGLKRWFALEEFLPSDLPIRITLKPAHTAAPDPRSVPWFLETQSAIMWIAPS